MVKSPRIILLDIETSPLTAYAWQAFDANALKILEFSKILSVSWKDLHSDEVFCKAICDYKGYKKGIIDDRRLVEEVWKVLDEADIIISHYGDRFDLPKLNSRFVYHGLTAPSSYKSIDTKKAASKFFKLDSNSLNNIAAYLNLGSKMEHSGFSLWDKCIQGDLDAWKTMKSYNVQDVLLLEKVYLAIRPFIANHPNLNLVSGESNSDQSCPTCQSISVTKRGFSATKTGTKQRYQCQDCGSWSSGPFVKTKNLLITEDD